MAEFISTAEEGSDQTSALGTGSRRTYSRCRKTLANNSFKMMVFGVLDVSVKYVIAVSEERAVYILRVTNLVQVDAST